MGKEYAGELTLASRGFFYDGKVPSGSIHVEPWGTLEERLFVSPNLNFEETIDRLIARCTDSPIPPHDLLLVDRVQLFLYMRCLSYGGGYQFRFMCGNCHETVPHPMDLEKDLSVRYADDKELVKALGLPEGAQLTEPFEVELPLQGKRLGWRMLRGKDERAVEKHVQRMQKGKASDERPDYIYRHALRLVTIDGKSVEDINEAMSQIESMKGKDALAWREAIDSVDFGVETEIEAPCRKCGYLNSEMLPLDKTFFRPPREGRSARS